VKPVTEKDLPASIVNTIDELGPYLQKGNDYRLYVSGPVRFVSEIAAFRTMVPAARRARRATRQGTRLPAIAV